MLQYHRWNILEVDDPYLLFTRKYFFFIWWERYGKMTILFSMASFFGDVGAILSFNIRATLSSSRVLNRVFGKLHRPKCDLKTGLFSLVTEDTVTSSTHTQGNRCRTQFWSSTTFQPCDPLVGNSNGHEIETIVSTMAPSSSRSIQFAHPMRGS